MAHAGRQEKVQEKDVLSRLAQTQALILAGKLLTLKALQLMCTC